MKIMSNLRQTGRTTRMLEEALSISESQTKPVVVVFYNQLELNQHKNGINKERYKNINFITLKNSKDLIDPQTLKLRKKSHDIIIFIDHGIVEVLFPHLVRILHQYDNFIRI